MGAESRTSVTLDPVFENYSLDRAARARTVRRVTLTLITILVLLGATGALGVRSGQVSANSGDYLLNVTYPSVARLGLAIVWKLEVRASGGFAGPVTVATTRSYFELVLVIVMGDAAQQGITQEDYLVTGAMLALGTMA